MIDRVVAPMALVLLMVMLCIYAIYASTYPPQFTHTKQWQRPCPTDEGELIAHPEKGQVCRRPEHGT